METFCGFWHMPAIVLIFQTENGASQFFLKVVLRGVRGTDLLRQGPGDARTKSCDRPLTHPAPLKKSKRNLMPSSSFPPKSPLYPKT